MVFCGEEDLLFFLDVISRLLDQFSASLWVKSLHKHENESAHFGNTLFYSQSFS